MTPPLPLRLSELALSPDRPLDGAMGTELLRLYGPPADGGPLVLWNGRHPEGVAAVHRAHSEAGASLLTTNTLLAPHLGAEGASLVRRGVDLAGSAGLPVALSLGPGAPAPEVYADLAASVAGVPHLVQLETFTDASAAAEAVRTLRHALPEISVVALLVFGADGRTLGCGTPAPDAAGLLLDAGVDAVGANCSAPDELGAAVAGMHAALSADVPLVLRPSAGIPCRMGERESYPWAPLPWAAAVRSLAESAAPGRAVLLGGCCGAGPAHITALASALAPRTRTAAAAAAVGIP